MLSSRPIIARPKPKWPLVARRDGLLPTVWKLLKRKRKAQFFGLLVIMIAASAAELFSLGMIVPFLAALAAPERVLNSVLVRSLQEAVPSLQRGTLAAYLGLAFCAAALLSGAVRLVMLYATTRYSAAVGADLSEDLYRTTLYQRFEVHFGRNSADVINGVVGKTNAVVNNVIAQVLGAISSALIALGIVVALFTVSPNITIGSVVGFVAIYGGILFWSRRRLARDSRTVAHESTQVIRALQEGLGGIRDVLLDNTQETFLATFKVSDRRMRAAQAGVTMTMAAPRYIVEALGMVVIALLAVLASAGGANPDVLPVLGVLALGAQRLLPVAQQAYAALITIRSSSASVADLRALLEKPTISYLPDQPALEFDDALELRHVHFHYSEEQPVLRGVELTVVKRTSVGIIGATGSGKSTLLDVIMGLLSPKQGEVLVDGIRVGSENCRGWQSNIAHVPQSIYLTDATIAENIAFGVPLGDINLERVRSVSALAQLDELVMSWPDAYDTVVGERGSRLSGGQRQRIGIARALYKDADFLVLDEGTSALDRSTEARIISSIESLGTKTILMVAHRLSTLANCDVVFEMKEGRLTKVTNFDELLGMQQMSSTHP